MGSTGMTVFGGVPDALAFIRETGTMIAKSRLAGCESIEQGMFFSMTCLARKCDPMWLAQRYDVIEGALRMKSVVMLGAFRRLGGRHRIIERTADAAEVELILDGESHRFRITWEEAKDEDFTQGKGGKVKSNYNTPRKKMQMLWYRVTSDGVSVMAPEILDGADEFPPDFSVSNESPVAHTGTAPPDVVASAPPAATPADSSGGKSKVVQGEIIDAEFEVQSKESDDRMVVQLNDPSTPDQKKTIIELMGRLKQDGVSDIADRVKAKLAESSIEGGLLGLTVSEADALIKALRTKETKVWFEAVIVGHEKANSGNG